MPQDNCWNDCIDLQVEHIIRSIKKNHEICCAKSELERTKSEVRKYKIDILKNEKRKDKINLLIEERLQQLEREEKVYHEGKANGIY